MSDLELIVIGDELVDGADEHEGHTLFPAPWGWDGDLTRQRWDSFLTAVPQFREPSKWEDPIFFFLEAKKNTPHSYSGCSSDSAISGLIGGWRQCCESGRIVDERRGALCMTTLAPPAGHQHHSKPKSTRSWRPLCISPSPTPLSPRPTGPSALPEKRHQTPPRPAPLRV